MSLETAGDLILGRVGNRFPCLAITFSDSGVVLVKVGSVGVEGERSRGVSGGVRRTGEEESAISEEMATNCKPNWSVRLKGCLHLSLTLFHFLVMAALVNIHR